MELFDKLEEVDNLKMDDDQSIYAEDSKVCMKLASSIAGKNNLDFVTIYCLFYAIIVSLDTEQIKLLKPYMIDKKKIQARIMEELLTGS